MASGDDGTIKLGGSKELQQFPGEECHAHVGAQWWEHAEAILAGLHLLAVAQGYEPASARHIKDINLAEIPELPTNHRDHQRRLESRIKVKAQNESNAEKRRTLKLEAWTQLYALFKTSTELTAPVFSRELKKLCDLSVTLGVEGGYFDGPRAYRMTWHKIHARERSEADKDYYRDAERIQRSSGSGQDFSKFEMKFVAPRSGAKF